MNVHRINDRTLQAIKENHELETHTDGEVQEKLKYESVEELFDSFLTWHGIIGYTGMIMNALKDIQEADNASSIP